MTVESKNYNIVWWNVQWHRCDIYDNYHITGEGYEANIVVSFPHSIRSGKILILNRLREIMNMTIPRETIKNTQRNIAKTKVE